MAPTAIRVASAPQTQVSRNWPGVWCQRNAETKIHSPTMSPLTRAIIEGPDARIAMDVVAAPGIEKRRPMRAAPGRLYGQAGHRAAAALARGERAARPARRTDARVGGAIGAAVVVGAA